jgi:hypothetical protein
VSKYESHKDENMVYTEEIKQSVETVHGSLDVRLSSRDLKTVTTGC